MTEEPDSFLDKLILDGVVEPSGVDSETGEILFSFTDKMKDEYPTMYQKMLGEFHKDVYSLWEQGFLDIDVTQLNPIVTVTDRALDSKQVSSLPDQLRVQLEIILNALRID
jgi:hypothetical protein